MMSSFVRRFSARANGGINSTEARRREEAARGAPVVLTSRFPPSLISDRLREAETDTANRLVDDIHAFLREPMLPPPELPTAEPEQEALTDGSAEAEEPISAETAFEAPIITITVSGPAYSGKTDTLYLIASALTYEGFPVQEPDGFSPRRWRRNLDRLARSGLRFVLVEETRGEP